MEREVHTNQEWSRMQAELEREYDIAAASGTNVTEWTPVRYNIKCHEEVYKTLATQGDFPCRIYYREEELDSERTSGIRSIVVLTSEEFLDPVGDQENSASVDVVPLTSLGERGFEAFLFNPLSGFKADFGTIKVTNFSIDSLDVL